MDLEESISPSAFDFSFLSFPAVDEDDDMGCCAVMQCRIRLAPGPAREGLTTAANTKQETGGDSCSTCLLKLRILS